MVLTVHHQLVSLPSSIIEGLLIPWPLLLVQIASLWAKRNLHVLPLRRSYKVILEIWVDLLQLNLP